MALAAVWRAAGGDEARAVMVEASTGWQEKGGQWARPGGKGGQVWLQWHHSMETGLEEDDQ